MNNIEEIKLNVKKAVELREQGKLNESRAIFLTILPALESLKDSPNIEDKKTYIGIMGQWIIQLKHESGTSSKQCFKASLDIYNYGKTNNLNDPNSIRGLSHSLIDMGLYEMAEPYVRETISLVSPEESARLGDEQAHLAICLFRTGKVDDSKKILEESLNNLDKNSENAPEFNVAVWKGHALMVKSLIAYNRGDKNEAIDLATQALELSKKHNISVRIEQAGSLVRFYSGN